MSLTFHCRESIFGYKELMIEIFYSSARLCTYLNMQYFDRISPHKFDGIEVCECIDIL
jgi:hypothetical protein